MVICFDDFADIDQADNFPDNAGFFRQFAQDGLLQGFAPFDLAARNRPFAGLRRIGPPDQQDFVAAHADGADRHDWT